MAAVSALEEEKERATLYAEKWDKVQRATGIKSIQKLVAFFFESDISTFKQVALCV